MPRNPGRHFLQIPGPTNVPERVLRARYMANLSKERWDEAVREHEQILAALTARDIPRLKRLLQDHLAHKLAAIPGALHKAA